MLGDQSGQVRRRCEGGVDLPRVARRAVVGPAEVQLEAVAAAAALEGQIGQVMDVAGGLLFGGRGGGAVEEVVGGEGVAGVEAAEVGAEEEGAGEGDAHHFVRVHGDGVGEVASGELGGVRGGEDCGATPRLISESAVSIACLRGRLQVLKHEMGVSALNTCFKRK